MTDWDENRVVMAFTIDQASRLSGLSRNQLSSWDRSGFYKPSYSDENRRLSYSRIYNFRDIASLRILHVLRNESRVPLSELRAVKEKLSHLGDDLWSKTTLYVLNRKVVFDSPDGKGREEITSGQGIINIPLKVVTKHLKEQVEKMKKRDLKMSGSIDTSRGDRPSISGTRVSVDAIKAFHNEGYSVDQILKEYPSITEADVKAAVEFKKSAQLCDYGLEAVRLFLDANVARSVGTAFEEAGHFVIYTTEVLPEKTPDTVVCQTAKANNCIVVAHDKDMKAMSRKDRFSKLGFILLYCNEAMAAKRVTHLMPTLTHEAAECANKKARRMFFEIHAHSFRSHR